jgi:hypothetical protein
VEDGVERHPFRRDLVAVTEFRIRVTVNEDGTWSYDEDTVMQVRGKDTPFRHRDRNTLTCVAEPTPNPLMRRAVLASAG